jgi:23S rRNA (cytosine1962-C5)-methyltransferase
MAYPHVELRIKAADRVLRGHPWVFKDGLARGLQVEPGAAVRLVDAHGEPLATGLADPAGDLAVRIFGGPDLTIDEAFFAERLSTALAQRIAWGVLGTGDAWRWLHGESDFLPGFVLDVYNGHGVLKLDAPYTRWMPAFQAAVEQSGQLRGLLYRPSSRVTGGDTSPQTLFGQIPPTVTVTEHGLRMEANLFSGQKTGMFLDQRENRRWVSERAAGHRVLNLFSYTGGFSLAALAGGAEHVTSVDIAPAALDSLERSLVLNSFSPESHTSAVEDCYAFLQRAFEQGRTWSLIVLDPPALAHNKAALDRALKAYERLNIAAMRVLEPGGVFCTASCTARVTPATFQDVVSRAAEKTERRLRIIHEAGAGADHPIALAFPEGRYLKFLGMQDD